MRLPNVAIGDARAAGQLLRESNYEFRYLAPDPAQAVVALLMPPAQQLTWQANALFAPMDQNLPEGELLARILELFPKQSLTSMQLLALLGQNCIGRLGYRLPDAPAPTPPPVLCRVASRNFVTDCLIDFVTRTFASSRGHQQRTIT